MFTRKKTERSMTTSVTRHVAIAPLNLKDQINEKNWCGLCDTPEFDDSAGAEAVSKANSVRIVLIICYGDIENGRASGNKGLSHASGKTTYNTTEEQFESTLAKANDELEENKHVYLQN